MLQYLRQILDISGLGKVLQIFEVLDESRIIEALLCGEVVEIERVGQTLDELEL